MIFPSLGVNSASNLQRMCASSGLPSTSSQLSGHEVRSPQPAAEGLFKPAQLRDNLSRALAWCTESRRR